MYRSSLNVVAHLRPYPGLRTAFSVFEKRFQILKIPFWETLVASAISACVVVVVGTLTPRSDQQLFKLLTSLNDLVDASHSSKQCT
ncbi:hypothetical protein TNCT_40641 [Trichonephila clavata]|uniref:Uncharacterized protein n=1 Tax=Trichonephila clavata TaxID=2740835 RepID=A0A8X6KNJ9_TRICU|nr:hypothetical protein TNCT_40641 [Trichonephila clavata]